MLVCILIVLLEFNWSWPSYQLWTKGLGPKGVAWMGLFFSSFWRLTAFVFVHESAFQPYLKFQRSSFGHTWNSYTLPLSWPLINFPVSLFWISESKWNLTVGKTLRSHFVSEKLRLAKAKWLACEHPPQPHCFPGLGWEDGNWVWPNITMAETTAVGHFLSQAGNRLCVFMICSTRGILKSMTLLILFYFILFLNFIILY